MGMIPSNLKNEIKARFSQLKEEVGKWLVVYGEPQKEGCPNCLQDYTGVSTGVYNTNFISPVEIFGSTISPTPFSRIRCPVCEGKGYLDYENSTRVHAIIRWDPPVELSRGEQVYTPGGVDGKNVCRVKADKKYYDLLRECVYVIIDGIKCELHLPPSIRHVGSEDVLVTAYFVSVSVDNKVREG